MCALSEKRRSSAQFRPLWLKVAPAGRLSVGAGDVSENEKHHHDDNGFTSANAADPPRELFSWQHPRRPEPKFVSFQTYRQRLVHVLIDCASE